MEDAEIDLRRIFGLIRRRTPLILAVTVAAVAITIAILLVLAPVYSATSLVVFDPQRKDLLDPSTQAGSGSADNARIESEVELLRSDTILLKVIATQNLLADVNAAPGLWARALAGIGLRPLPEQTDQMRLGLALAKLRRDVSIERRGPTYLIAVQARSGDPVQAAKLANAIAQTYIDSQIASKVGAMLSSRDVLQAHLADARDEIVSSEAAFNSFLQQSTLQLSNTPGGSDVRRLTGEIDALSAARERMDQVVETVAASLAGRNWGNLAAALQTEQVSILDGQRQALAQQIASTDVSSPAATELQGQLANIEAELSRSADFELENLRTRLATLSDQELGLRDELRSEVMQSDLPADILTGLFDLQSKAAFARDHYQLLLNRSLELQNQSNLQVADSRIASPALPPSAHSFPSTGMFLAVAVFAGLVTGVAVSIVYESLVGGFMSQEQLEAALRTRVAATVPRLKLEPGNDTLADLVITAPLSQLAEAMRRMRIAIDQMAFNPATARPEQGRVVMVTSAVPGEGKSMAATALARSYALSGRRTLLIDCDLRTPSIATQLDITPPSGLLEILMARSQTIDLRSAIQHETDTGLSLLLGARGTDRPADTLLASAKFERLVNEAAKMFEIVLLDTPPVEPVVDALYVAPRADIIVLVTRWASTSQRETRQALASLMQAKHPSAQILSLLNGKDEPAVRRRQAYRRFYDADYA